MIVELLRTLKDARDDINGSGEASGGGVIQMPALYHHGSYQELERCLGEMYYTDPTLRWHLLERYIKGDVKFMKVPSRKTRQGRHPLMPPGTELRIQIETVENGMVWVQYYTWNAKVDPALVTAGVDRLTDLMYGGEWWRLTLPKPFLERLAVA